VTVEGVSVANEELREEAVSFCRSVGFRGIGSMDWRFDRRDGRYKLLDFNVRLGAMFRMFQTPESLDVARALHLDLTGRPVPLAREIQSRRYVVGNLALRVGPTYRRDRSASTRVERFAPGGVERAWIATDDPMPALLVTIRSAALGLRQLRRQLQDRLGAAAGGRAGPGTPTGAAPL
jgi:predicted ATP-grasp superfamily ATP-dependent carboligase